jgi:hypothetical protein
MLPMHESMLCSLAYSSLGSLCAALHAYIIAECSWLRTLQIQAEFQLIVNRTVNRLLPNIVCRHCTLLSIAPVGQMSNPAGCKIPHKQILQD